MYKQVILSRLKEYLEKKKWTIKKSGKVVMLLCPFCKKEPLSANIIPNTNIVHCFNCPEDKNKYNLLDIAKEIEEKFPGTEEEQLQYLKKLLKIDVVTKKDENEIVKMLDFYEKNGFDLVPIMKNGKAPIEKDWTNKSHKDKKEWLEWIKNGLNIGVKTGVKSGITIIDIDQKPIPEEVKQLVKNVLIQETKNGFHLFFKYDKDFPKTRINDLKIDLENNGGQVVLYPSIVEGVGRKFLNSEDVTKMPEALKKLLLSKIDLPNLKTNSEKIIEDIKTGDFKIKPEDFKLKNNNLEGVCNSSFIKLGGILRKELNLRQTEFVLNLLNNHLLEDPMEQKAIRAMIRELEKYTIFDEQELALKVLQYMRDAEDATRNDVVLAVMGTNRGEEKKRIDKILNYLVREGYLIKRGRSYHIVKKVEWEDNLIDIGRPINFKCPYFDDIAHFNWGDLILIGSLTEKGKTHMAINIVKRLVRQGIVPYYIGLEAGSRYGKIALQLGLKEGDFKHPKNIIVDPTKVELEPNAITIIDWLMIVDKAKTDLVFSRLVEQLGKTKGFLFVFQQLKGIRNQKGEIIKTEWFAPNMATQFPSLATRYEYTDNNEGIYGEFIIDKVRERKWSNKRKKKLPCKYNWQTKELKRIDELEENKDKKE